MADVDGSHIDALILRFFLLYMPQLIQAGKLYRAVPPLYSIPKKGGKKGEQEYFTENIDFIRYVQKLFVKSNDLKKMDKSSISNRDMSTFFLLNADYVYWIERLATTYGVEPLLMEIALFNHYNNTTVKALQKQISSKYRFMNVYKEKDTIVFDGIINDSNTLFLNDRFVKDCKVILDIIGKNKGGFYYKMNGETRSIYEIMKAFEATQPNHLQRYKGLGEMQPEQIAQSTLLPTGDRSLIQYTIEDVKETIDIINKYESDFTKLFKFVGEVTRQDLLD